MSDTNDPFSDGAASPPPHEKAMGFWDHLNELRGTIIKSLLVFGAFVGLIAYYLPQFNHLVMQPFDTVLREYPALTIKLGTTSMTEGFTMLVQICMMGGLLLSAPFILFFIGQFVAPALTAREKQAVLPMCVSAFLLFVAGSAFGFFVLAPSAVRVFIEINLAYGWEFRWTVQDYYSNVTHLVLGLGAGFQFPLVIVLLAWLGIVSTKGLRKYRRHAIVGIFVIAAIATPGGDPTLQALFAAPLCVLYELAIFASARVEKRRDRSAAAAILALFALVHHTRRKPSSAKGRMLPAEIGERAYARG